MAENRTYLVVVAHPDDCELTCAGAVARFVTQGDTGVLLVATGGGRGGRDPGSVEEVIAATRRHEQQDAAAVIGFQEVVWLGFTDGELQNDLLLRGALVEHVRRVRPDVAIFMDPLTVIYRDSYVNHSDHRALGMALLDALYPQASNAGYFPEHITRGLTPHKVPEILLAQTERPNFWVDVSNTLDVRFDALRCHRSQMRLWPDGGEAIIQQQRAFATDLGAQYGVQYAEEFRRVVVNPLA
ncbi:MAG: PIG-L family deacetylase [Chloroflexota bacterium]